ncbi:MAG: tRNA 2-thiouridine(34) synthase MnmA [Anaerolineae bacterium]|nr:tRNA 2-thiouridine(34) synthase MnmA [Anaerolineae bacterium]
MSGSIVAAALSGGVDSAAAALLLLEQGYRVIGVTMRLWQEPASRTAADASALRDATVGARHVAEALGIPLHVIDASAPFKRLVVDRFIAEYSAGRTPNPCLYCNRHLKFDYLLDRALALGADRLATGHYARAQLAADGSTWQLLKGLDPEKDQSYFLYMLGQRELSRSLFPLGEWTKERVRALAAERGLPSARTEESQDLCFVPDSDYRRFLRQHAPHVFAPGPIRDSQGRELGRHQGLVNYTVGQRSGIGVAAAEPLYVLRLEPDTNVLVVGPLRELGREALVAMQVRWVSGQVPPAPVHAAVKIRYRARCAQAEVTPLPGARASVHFERPLRDITPGQGVVFYQGQVVLGGGLIADTV